MKMTLGPMRTHNQIFMSWTVRTNNMANARVKKSKWKLIEMDSTATRDHTRRAGAAATMSTARRRGTLILKVFHFPFGTLHHCRMREMLFQ